MSRPRYLPGQTARFETRNRSGKKPLAGYLASRLGVVDAWAADLIAGGCVTMDGAPARFGALINLSGGRHLIEVRFPGAWPRHMGATEMPLDILHEDEHLVAVNKPPGIVVHPSRGHLDNRTLQNGVRYRYRHLLHLGSACVAPPHRLDKDTSGVIVFALTRAAYAGLVRQFSANEPRKTYLAIVDGTPDFEETASREAIGRDQVNPRRGALVGENRGGKPAETFFRVLAAGNGLALVEAKPKTGRSHQIRLHLAGLGLPVAGDRDYHPDPDRHGAPRQALHAIRLELAHPVSGEHLAFSAAFPGDLEPLLAEIPRTPST